jgi:hypothetical protein
LSGGQDSNLIRPSRPKAGYATGLNYLPKIHY